MVFFVFDAMRCWRFERQVFKPIVPLLAVFVMNQTARRNDHSCVLPPNQVMFINIAIPILASGIFFGRYNHLVWAIFHKNYLVLVQKIRRFWKDNAVTY